MTYRPRLPVRGRGPLSALVHVWRWHPIRLRYEYNQHHYPSHTFQYRGRSLFHLLRNFLVDGATEVLHGAFPAAEHDRRAIVRRETAWFRVHTHKVECGPHGADELVHVQPILGGYRNAVRDLVKQVQLLYRDCIDFVQNLADRLGQAASIHGEELTYIAGMYTLYTTSITCAEVEVAAGCLPVSLNDIY